MLITFKYYYKMIRFLKRWYLYKLDFKQLLGTTSQINKPVK